jgi:DNA-binding NarL/FixJ family response regulator
MSDHPPKTRVLVVDDHPFFRTGIVHWLNQQGQLTCCGEAGSIAAARRLIQELRPDIVLLDLRLGDGDGIEFTREVTGEFPDLRILVVSQCGEETYAHRALRAGARGYVMKSEATDTVATAIEAILEGEVFLGRNASARILRNLFPDPAARQKDLHHLSDRELEVFQMLGAGLPPREIARSLGISPKTVDTYREHLKNKLGFLDGASLLRAATLWVETGQWNSTKPPDAPPRGR